MRKRLRFSLKALLVFFTVLLVLLGMHMHGARRQAEAVRIAREYGGRCVYDYAVQRVPGVFPAAGLRFAPKPKPWAPVWLVRLVGVDFFQSVHQVAFRHTRARVPECDPDTLTEILLATPKLKTLEFDALPITDEHLAIIARCGRELRHLSVTDASGVSDKGLRQLRALPRLDTLILRDAAQITDDSLAVISGLPELEVLYLYDCPITDAGISHLMRLDGLRVLNLVGYYERVAITDAGILPLVALPNLEKLNVSGARVTNEGVSEFRKQRPDCRIDR